MRNWTWPPTHGQVRSVLHYNGLPIDARSVTDEILVQEGRKEKTSVHAGPVAAGLHAGGE